MPGWTSRLMRAMVLFDQVVEIRALEYRKQPYIWMTDWH